MRLISINLKNYRKYADERVDFPDGLVGILGPNGSGKSSLMEAVGWALFGNAAARTAKEEIKRQGALPGDICEAVLELELGGTTYQIVRETRGKDASSDAAVYTQKELLARGARSTLEYVNKMLGMDREAFFTSFFAKQKELNTLSELTPAERKTSIIKMLGINRVDNAIDLLKKDLRDLTVKVNTLRMALQDPKKLKEQKLKEKKRITGAKEILASRKTQEKKSQEKFLELKKTLESQEKKKEEHNSLSQQYKVALEGMKEKKQSLKTDEEEFQIFKFLKNELRQKPQTNLTATERELTSLREKKIHLQSKISYLRDERDKLTKNRENVDQLGKKSSCPTCLRPLGTDIDKIRDHFNAEIIAREQKIDGLKKEVAGFKKKEEQKEKELVSLRREQERLLKIETQVKHLEKIEVHIEKTKKELAEKAKAIAVIKEEGKALKFSLEKFKETKKNCESAQEGYHQATNRAKDALHEVKLIEMNLQHLERELKEYREKKREIEELSKDQENLERLQEILGLFRKNLIGRIRPVLSEKAASLLAELTDSKYAELELTEDYEVLLYDQGQKFPLERFSGGEKDLVNLCLRLAISELMTETSLSDFGFIVLDEIFGSQDPLRKTNIMRALAKLSSRFRQIFLITHVEEVKDSMEYVVSVSDDESGVSHLTLE